ncbi:hypothetical protein B0H14DRAFT_2729793 [Mycena olivaceomarginata]|nr:hypothetical protein B0H14DRAFT_2936163 [Mycena olivaceomarginata]KAJ7793766.1 hypothetical protein B0H14DRAFT_2925453 [Mycena olivaceomarginata]KAJ7804655.1 hypothetical protein B0H14DRAFT_2883525 [Mycena olivaceomarginata]KAJ7838613.1 hypothetical protein B0H14DRAFT_2788965 [Mycena olivaceomarginata]KAJ7842967.1 hypothetical protein B0H14DRAFT_2779750 [Mycena olivaceomarginata]
MFCRASTFTFSLVFSCLLTFFLSSCRYRWWLAGAAVCLGGGLFFRFIVSFKPCATWLFELRSWLCFLYFSFLVLEYLAWFIFLPSPYIFLPLSLRLAVR